MERIKEMPDDLRPYERCIRLGASSLTDIELLAVLLRTGTREQNVLALAAHLLYEVGGGGGLSGLLGQTYESLLTVKGIGKVKAVQIVCLAELANRLWRSKNQTVSVAFLNPEIAASYYMQEMRRLNREELRLAFLDTRQCLIKDMTVSIGTVNASLVSVREILIEALRHKAVNLLMLHNHPSGNPSPSPEDRLVTRTVKSGCECVGIRLNDHIIIGDNRYYSFKEQGAL